MTSGRHKINELVHLCILISILLLNLCGCGDLTVTPPNAPSSLSPIEMTGTDTVTPPTSTGFSLPDITSFAADPSEQFILDADGFEMVSHASPFNGSGTACAHQGAHVHFRSTGSDYTVNVYSPASGIIRLVTPCFNIGATDRYGFSLEFARDGDDPLVFNFSIEPQDGTPCTTNMEAYQQYIFVKDGQEVVKGQLLGQMLKTAAPGDGAHIHFDIQKERTGSFHCPNIFGPSVVMDFASHFCSDTCAGTPYPATFCYDPTPGEDLTGLVSIP
jgi:hypothetical protein